MRILFVHEWDNFRKGGPGGGSVLCVHGEIMIY